MSAEEPIIEAEVVEIDGVSVEPRPVEPIKNGDTQWTDWRRWQARIKMLDGRWRPLWLVLGFVALVLIVVAGICAAVIGVTYWIFKSTIRGIVSLIMPSSELGSR